MRGNHLKYFPLWVSSSWVSLNVCCAKRMKIDEIGESFSSLLLKIRSADLRTHGQRVIRYFQKFGNKFEGKLQNNIWF